MKIKRRSYREMVEFRGFVDGKHGNSPQVHYDPLRAYTGDELAYLDWWDKGVNTRLKVI